MKIQTNILPRRDGAVRLRSSNGKTYVFQRDESGAMTCDIDDEDVLAQLLLRDSEFEPADAADFEGARAMIAKAVDAAEDEPDSEPDSEPDDDEPTPDAPPVEAHTPPRASARPRRAR